MKYEELHRRVYQELGEGAGPEQLFEALLKVIAPFLGEPHQFTSHLLYEKARKLNLVDPANELKDRCLANWDQAAFCEKIGVDYREFIEGLW